VDTSLAGLLKLGNVTVDGSVVSTILTLCEPGSSVTIQ